MGIGGYLAYANAARDQYYGEFQGSTLGYERSILGELNRLDYGVAAGLHYHFKGNPGSQIRVSYQLGFNPVFKDASVPEAYNENLQIAGGYLPGRGHRIVEPGSVQRDPPDVILVMNPADTDGIRARLGDLGLSPELLNL